MASPLRWTTDGFTGAGDVVDGLLSRDDDDANMDDRRDSVEG